MSTRLNKLIIQINCLNEEQTLPITYAALPKKLPGIDTIETLVVDDGSSDNTVAIARELGVDHILCHHQNRGLPAAVNTGMLAAISLGADILVNTDADNQYQADDIIKLVQPILDKQADVVYGERPVMNIPHFSNVKKVLHFAGAKIVSWAAGTRVVDAASGFRAINKEAMCRLYLLGDYASPLEVIIQSNMKKLGFLTVTVRTNPVLRPSRLFRSNFFYVVKSAGIILDNLIIYRPLQAFWYLGGVFIVFGSILTAYRIYLINLTSSESEHLTMLIAVVISFILGIQLFFFGLSARLQRAMKLVNDESLYRKNLEIWGAKNVVDTHKPVNNLSKHL